MTSIMKVFHCELCHKILPDRHIILMMHMRAHASKKLHECEVCRKTFSKVEHLKLHENMHRDNTVSHQRENVQVGESTTSYQRENIQADEAMTSHQQENMQAGETTTFRQQENMQVVKSRSYQCGFCRRSFPRLNNLSHHKKIHYLTTKNFKCKICYRAFSNAAALNLHERMHFRGSLVELMPKLKV